MGPHPFIECQILVPFQAEKVTHSGDGVLETLWRPPDRGQNLGGLVEPGAGDESLLVERPCATPRQPGVRRGHHGAPAARHSYKNVRSCVTASIAEPAVIHEVRDNSVCQWRNCSRTGANASMPAGVHGSRTSCTCVMPASAYARKAAARSSGVPVNAGASPSSTVLRLGASGITCSNTAAVRPKVAGSRPAATHAASTMA